MFLLFPSRWYQRAGFIFTYLHHWGFVNLCGAVWLGHGKCPVLPGEVGVPSVTRPPPSGGTTPMGMWWGDGASGEIPRLPHVTRCCQHAALSEVGVGVGVGVTGLGREEQSPSHLWPCSVPSSGSCYSVCLSHPWVKPQCACYSGRNMSARLVVRTAACMRGPTPPLHRVFPQGQLQRWGGQKML